ncbi:polysaccharide biosynthesis C-terminal domain-containing protein [Marinoscillum sp. MHG1-6]|uniref:oligosaccharide flippase family protein n=1 Tax=Marinoscillum sp. MHG1-6 TaxID=2959627 RepID=UPI002157EEF7|nr:polysaccharide biosynthesis C-terminal domain-containing protein [Marinoscillum sp. MHG1-6]
MMIILSGFSLINWPSFVVIQIITAYEGVGWVNKAQIVRTVLIVLATILSIHFDFTLVQFFLFYSACALGPIVVILVRVQTVGLRLLDFIRPKWDWNKFREVFHYSLNLFAMAVFQLSALELQPILLGARSEIGVESVADYQIIKTISSFLVVIGGIFMQVLLPEVSKYYAKKDFEKLKKTVENGTLYITIFLSLLIFGLVLNSQEVLTLYVGTTFTNLGAWLNVALITCFYLHISAISSVVLASGKTKVIALSSAIGCVLSLILAWYMIPIMDYRAAVFAYTFYISIQMLTYYFYYIPRIMMVNSFKLFFKRVVPVFVISAVSFLLVNELFSQYSGELKPLASLVLKSILFGLIYLIMISVFLIRTSQMKPLVDLVFKKR